MSRNNKDKGRIGGQFVPLLHEMMDCPAYMAMSHGAKCLYHALKRRVPRANNRAYLSYRMARRELKASFNKVKEWFAELEHYGFIVLAAHGSLGVDGKGKAPHWRLTELGHVAGRGTEFPSKEYLRWDGVLFEAKQYRHGSKWGQKQNPAIHVNSTPLSTSKAPPLSTSIAPKAPSAIHGVNIGSEETAIHVSSITSLTTGEVSAQVVSEIGPESCVAQNDDRVIALEATEKRLKSDRSHNG